MSSIKDEQGAYLSIAYWDELALSKNPVPGERKKLDTYYSPQYQACLEKRELTRSFAIVTRKFVPH